MTDAEIILNILSDGNYHNILEIIHRAKPCCINFAARSRISDLRKKGYSIESEIDTNGCAKYRLKNAKPVMEFDKTTQQGILCGMD
jgi:hypothetical protein